jgi:putative transposase
LPQRRTLSTIANGLLQKSTVKAVKSISFKYWAGPDLVSLFEVFRLMCNDAIRIAVSNRPESKFGLITLAYRRLKDYGLHTHYILSACEVAYSVYKNKNRKKAPYIKRAFLKLDNQSYRINHLLLRIPATPREHIFLTLQGSSYHLSYLDDQELKMGSVTINERSVVIAFSKTVSVIEPLGFIGLDVNEKNISISSTKGREESFTKLGEVEEIKERYREIRVKLGRLTQKDNRVGRRLFAKYSRREKNRTAHRIHGITKKIVDIAEEDCFGIKMEKLTGIRKLYRKGNGKGRAFRGRMNTWVFGETQRQIGYKAAWLGMPVYYVNPRGTSSKCLCGSRVVPLADRKLYCPKCDKTWDRDDLASKNIMACAVPQVRSAKGSDEKERGDDGSNPSSR